MTLLLVIESDAIHSQLNHTRNSRIVGNSLVTDKKKYRYGKHKPGKHGNEGTHGVLPSTDLTKPYYRLGRFALAAIPSPCKLLFWASDFEQ
jgi:hypothetical protein